MGDGDINNRLVFGTLFAAFLFYFATVYTSGTYPPKNYDVLWTGVVAQEDDPQ